MDLTPPGMRTLPVSPIMNRVAPNAGHWACPLILLRHCARSAGPGHIAAEYLRAPSTIDHLP
jgi:hypothetical protein